MAENNAKAAKPRGPGRPFQPGQSGNPGGRPKLREHVRERAANAVDEYVVDAWIREVVEQGEDWVKCSELLAAYGIGKPGAAPEDLEAMKGNNPLAGLTTEQILAVARGGE